MDVSTRTDFMETYRLTLQSLKDRFGGRLKCVVLFGSQARGEAIPGSDHDIFVVISGLPRDPVKRQRTVRLVLLPVLDCLPGSIGIVAKTPREVSANLTPLLLDVCVDGVCLYGEAYFEPLRQNALAAIEQAGLYRKRVAGNWTWRFSHPPSGAWEISWEGYREISR